jgi:7-cyano-7-deazaguanine synthase
MLDNRLNNLMIVDRSAREAYYAKTRNLGIVLALSGGLDSTTVLHWCLRVFGRVHCVVFDYKQRHTIEIETALSYVEDLLEQEQYQGRIKITKADMSAINFLAPSALTRDDIDVPASRSIEEMGSDIPSTFVPGRNVYFTTALAQVAYTEGWRHIALGANILDYSGYPDCRPEFFDAMRTALRIGIFNGTDVGMHMPLMKLTKVQIIRLGNHLGVDYAKTHSCYNNVPGGCGTCDSCLLRRDAFKKCDTVDPAIALHQPI